MSDRIMTNDRFSSEANRILLKSEKHGWTKCSGILAHCAIRDEIANALRAEAGKREDDDAPWWVVGAEVHSLLDFLAGVPAHLAKVRVKDVDNDDGFCLREQVWFDTLGVGINRVEGRRIRRALDKLNGRKRCRRRK